jgi:hypothetical protein
MITADTLKTLTTFTPHALKLASGQAGVRFESAKFLGITNGGQFCYSVTTHEGVVGKVFLTYDPAAGKVSADCDLTVWA